MVPVLDKNKNPLMPCSEKRARKLMERGEVKPYWCKGVFCIILQRDPSDNQLQDICVGIDPGSKFNGYSIKSETHTLLNIQCSAIDFVKRKIKDRSLSRASRRRRSTPYRKCRPNRSVKSFIPPSTKSRWDQHLNIIKWLSNMYYITHVVIEDIKAKTKKGARKWNVNFTPLEVGKHSFEMKIKSMGLAFSKYKGYETYQMRQDYGFRKNSKKDKKCFYTHCVDAWCLANEVVGGHLEVDNEKTIFLKPLNFYRRKLHELVPKKGNVRKSYGGTRSMGISKGTLVKHPKLGLVIVGGSSKGRVSVHSISDNKRLCQKSVAEDLKILTNLKWNIS